MTENLKPLPIHPWPVAPETMQLIKRAKAELDVPFLVLPRPAVIGSPGIVLALGIAPTWICDYALVKDVTKYESIKAALDVVLSGKDDPRVTTVLNMLEKIMPGIKEIKEEENAV